MKHVDEKILSESLVLEERRTQTLSLYNRIDLIDSLWKDLNRLLSSLITGYADYGKNQKELYQTIEKFRTTFKSDSELERILFTLATFSKSIGGFYLMSSSELSVSLREKSYEFNSKVYQFKKSAQQYLKELENLKKLIQEFKEENEFFQEIPLREPENNTDKITIQKNTEFQSKELCTLLESYRCEFSDLCKRLLQIEQIFIENIEKIVLTIALLSLNLSECRKGLSDSLMPSLLSISLPNSFTQTLIFNNKAKEFLEMGESKIKQLIFVKNQLLSLSKLEESIDNCYMKYKIFSFINTNISELAKLTLTKLKGIENCLSLHVSYSEEIKIDIIKPIEDIILKQNDIISSLKSSLAKAKPQPAGQRKSSNADSVSSNAGSESIPADSTQITNLLIAYKFQESYALSSVKALLSLLHIKNETLYIKTSDFCAQLFKSTTLIVPHLPKHPSNSELLKIDSPSTKSLLALKNSSRNEFIPQIKSNLSTDNQELSKRFNACGDQTVVSSYLCALNDTILLQGKLYLTTSALYFFSYFNSSTIIGKETKFKIALSDIKKLKKKNYLFIFANSIEITTNSAVYFFTSFVSRNEAYSILSKLLLLNKRLMINRKEDLEFIVESRIHRLQLRKKLRETQEIAFTMLPDRYFLINIFDQDVEFDAKISEVYQRLFSNSCREFLEEFYEASGDVFVSASDWSAQAPSAYSGITEKIEANTATRLIKAKHRIKERLPFLPTHCNLIEKQTIHFLSSEKFVVECVLEVDAPYGDYFKSYLRWNVSQADSVKISAQYGMVFNKYTIFQSKIVNQGNIEVKETLNTIWKALAAKRLCNISEPTNQNPIKPEIPMAPEVKPIKSSTDWRILALIAVLLTIILTLIKKINELESIIFTSNKN